ncbi:nucleoside triphosphate pyrophosphohydrolase [Natrarchaeobius chitinivorans]|uniref:nucleoside triphosphate pyrophosphohydrolase n=1 Tax=Natrarchaeobius chitinivorans TaxID=1679083 RepID=UPI001FB2F83F|nr:nucleoside triphosphate pyrophosphohydrolase [Natrarchaeobius chitinivorans]
MPEYDKLVRDRIPEIIYANDQRPETHVVDGDEYADRLAAKLREEAVEFDDSENSRNWRTFSRSSTPSSKPAGRGYPISRSDADRSDRIAAGSRTVSSSSASTSRSSGFEPEWS